MCVEQDKPALIILNEASKLTISLIIFVCIAVIISNRFTVGIPVIDIWLAFLGSYYMACFNFLGYLLDRIDLICNTIANLLLFRTTKVSPTLIPKISEVFKKLGEIITVESEKFTSEEIKDRIFVVGGLVGWTFIISWIGGLLIGHFIIKYLKSSNPNTVVKID